MMKRWLISSLLLFAFLAGQTVGAADTPKAPPGNAQEAAKPAAPPAKADAAKTPPAGNKSTPDTGTAATTDTMDPELREKAEEASDAGLRYLRQHQLPNGSWSNSVGITALALRGFLESHRHYDEGDGPFMTRAVQFILDNVNDDGSISETKAENGNYNTATAITALQATNNPTYAAVIKKGQDYIRKSQTDEGQGYTPDHKYYGGFGYGGGQRPDLPNTYMALEALKATGVDANDPVWKKAQIFINHCQNRTESNDQKWAANDGGFIYIPGQSPHGGTGSYGGMTHSGLISLLFAGVDKQDPRIQAAYNWIRATYTLDENPNVKGKKSLFYYYNAFAKTMYAYGEPEITDANGIKHNWRNDLVKKLISLQAPDGSWVNTESTVEWEGNKDLVTAWSVIALNLAAR